jgi:hypothetical protein
LHSIGEDVGQRLVLLQARQDRLTLLGYREGNNSLQRQEQGAAQHREEHSPQPQASCSARCEVGTEGEGAEDQKDQAEDTAEQVADHVFVGGDEAGPGPELGVGVWLAFEARPEGQRSVEG